RSSDLAIISSVIAVRGGPSSDDECSGANPGRTTTTSAASAAAHPPAAASTIEKESPASRPAETAGSSGPSSSLHGALRPSTKKWPPRQAYHQASAATTRNAAIARRRGAVSDRLP